MHAVACANKQVFAYVQECVHAHVCIRVCVFAGWSLKLLRRLILLILVPAMKPLVIKDQIFTSAQHTGACRRAERQKILPASV